MSELSEVTVVEINGFLVHVNSKNKIVELQKGQDAHENEDELFFVHPSETVTLPSGKALLNEPEKMLNTLYPVKSRSIDPKSFYHLSNTDEIAGSEARALLFDIAYRGLEAKFYRSNAVFVTVISCQSLFYAPSYNRNKLDIKKDKEGFKYKGASHFYPIPPSDMKNEFPVEFPLLPFIELRKHDRLLLNVERSIDVGEAIRNDPMLLDSKMDVEEIIDSSKRIEGETTCFYSTHNLFTALYCISKIPGHVVHYKPITDFECLTFLKDAYEANIKNIVLHIGSSSDLELPLSQFQAFVDQMRIDFKE